MKKSGASQGQSASELISKRIAELGDWRGETLSRMRKLIKEAAPDVVEEWKWMGTPIWSHDGIICTGESYKNVVKLTFAKGAFLKDPARLFNSSLDGNVRRAIDIHEGEEVDESAFKALVRQAVALNSSGKSKPSKKEAAALDVDGTDRSPFVDVTAANSIDNRLTKLLEYLAAQQPEEDWSRYLAHHKPKWSQIAISGHSGRGVRGDDREASGGSARGAVRVCDGQRGYAVGSVGCDPPDAVGPLLRTRARSRFILPAHPCELDFPRHGGRRGRPGSGDTRAAPPALSHARHRCPAAWRVRRQQRPWQRLQRRERAAQRGRHTGAA